MGHDHHQPAAGLEPRGNAGKHRRDGVKILKRHHQGRVIETLRRQHRIQLTRIAKQVTLQRPRAAAGRLDQRWTGVDANTGDAAISKHAAKHALAAGDVKHTLTGLGRELTQHCRQHQLDIEIVALVAQQLVVPAGLPFPGRISSRHWGACPRRIVSR